MARKPSNLIYGEDARPPLLALLTLAVQHSILIMMLLVYPIVVAAAVGLPPHEARALVAASILAAGIGTIVQCWPSRLGSGYLAVHTSNPVYIPAMIQAGMAGGPALMAGMTICGGVIGILVSRVLRPLRRLLPAEVCGVSVFLLGVSLVVPGLDRAMSAAGVGGVLHFETVVVAAATLGLILAISIFGKGLVRFLSVPIGAGVGWGLALALDVGASVPPGLYDLPLIGFPIGGHGGWHVDATLLPAVVLAALITSIDNFGLMLALQRMNDADWRRADIPGAARGVQAEGIGNVINGLLGSFPTGVSSSNVALCFATGVTARIVGIAAGGVLIIASFSPRIAGAFTAIPPAVIGAILLYAAAYMIASGMELILSRRLSERRVTVVGLSTIAGLSVLAVPGVYSDLPEVVRPLFSTPLTIGTVSAILLNLLLQIGISRAASVTVPPGADLFELVQEFLERQGEAWGARRDVIAAAIPTTALALDAVVDSGLAKGSIELNARFDETNLDLDIVYPGDPLEIPTSQPSPESLFADDRAIARFVGWTLSQLADGIRLRHQEGTQTVALRFDH
ncbi:MAG: uracil-xanthine permease family protein [Alphaproteobacteria bacterium]